MGFLFSTPKPQQPNPKIGLQSQVQSVDVIKVKLKHVRDRLKQYIKLKEKQQAQISQKIKQLVPEYEETGCKKKMAPYLKAKKSVKQNIEQAQIQLDVILQNLNQVEVAQMNKDTVDVLEQANKYTDQIMKEMEAKDWQNIINESQKKYQLDWPEDQQKLEDDPAFRQMWKQIGGQQLDSKAIPQKNKKVVERKKINVEIPSQANAISNSKQLQQHLA